jgi:hypothetical protein
LIAQAVGNFLIFGDDPFFAMVDNVEIFNDLVVVLNLAKSLLKKK